MESFLVSSIKDPGTWYVEINELSVDWLVGSWRLKASSVECWSIPSVDPRHSINTQINTGPTLDHSCSVNSCLSVPQLMHRWEISQLSTCCGSNVKRGVDWVSAEGQLMVSWGSLDGMGQQYLLVNMICFIYHLTNRLTMADWTDSLTHSLTHWLTNWLSNCLFYWLIDWLIEWLIDWLID